MFYDVADCLVICKKLFIFFDTKVSLLFSNFLIVARAPFVLVSIGIWGHTMFSLSQRLQELPLRLSYRNYIAGRRGDHLSSLRDFYAAPSTHLFCFGWDWKLFSRLSLPVEWSLCFSFFLFCQLTQFHTVSTFSSSSERRGKKNLSGVE